MDLSGDVKKQMVEAAVGGPVSPVGKKDWMIPFVVNEFVSLEKTLREIGLRLLTSF